MADIKIQQGEVEFGASADTLDEDITEVGSLTSAFVRVVNLQFMSSGPSATTTTNRNDDDLGVSVSFVDTDTIRFERASTGEDVDYTIRYEVWEYTGPAGGANEFIVREFDTEEIPNGTLSHAVDISSKGIDDYDNTVPVYCSGRGMSTGRSLNRVMATLDIRSGDDELRIVRAASIGSAFVSYALVEFTGSAWSVQADIQHTFTAAGAVETETITDVGDWDTAFIFASWRTPNPNLDEISALVFAGATTTTVRFALQTGANNPGQFHVFAHVVQHDDVSVEHIDSLVGGEDNLPGTTDLTKDYTVSAVSALANTGLIANAAQSGTGNAYPRCFWNYYLTSTTNLRFERHRHTNNSEFSAQIIDFGDVITVAPVLRHRLSPFEVRRLRM